MGTVLELYYLSSKLFLHHLHSVSLSNFSNFLVPQNLSGINREKIAVLLEVGYKK